MTNPKEIKPKVTRKKRTKSAPIADLFSFIAPANKPTTHIDNNLDNSFTITETEQILGVHDYLEYISHIVQMAKDIKVLGEISRISHHQTGIYLTLKDKETDSVLSCYINPYTYKGLGLSLEEGMEVKLTGVPSIFKRRSELSLRVENVELAGEGALKKQYEMLKSKLEAEGLFDRKREIPEFISSIGIITSRTGAVIHDFRTNLGKLGISLYLKDCRVEGAQAAQQIIKAIQYFNNAMPELDCLVVMRGGGSLEDLQAFNNESVVREMFASKIPIICAIGHDRDVPLAQLVSDNAQSTPTAVAGRVTNSWARLHDDLPRLTRDLLDGFETQLSQSDRILENNSRKLLGKMEGLIEKYNLLRQSLNRGAMQILTRVGQIKIATENYQKQLLQTIKFRLAQVRDSVALLSRQVEQANPKRQLKLGYSILRDQGHAIVRSVEQIKIGDSISAELHNGTIISEVISK